MLKQRLKAVSLGIFFLLGISLVCLFGSLFTQEQEEKEVLEVNAVPTARRYGIQGLPENVQLQEQPDFATDEYIYFQDRTLTIYHNSSDKIDYTTEAIRTFIDGFPNINSYVMLVPSRIAFEENMESYTDDCLAAIEQIYNKLPENYNKLDLKDVLSAHRDEYIYFRTDEGWTALGAYYGAGRFCQEKNITLPGLEEFLEYRYEGYAGVHTYLPDSKIPKANFDYVAYYLMDGSANWEHITERRNKELYETYETATVSLSRRGTDIFIGGRYSHAILKGDGREGNTLLLIGDSSAKIVAPWLTPYYEQVYLINADWYQDGSEGIEAILAEYHVSDILLVESVANFGETACNQSLKLLAPYQE